MANHILDIRIQLPNARGLADFSAALMLVGQLINTVLVELFALSEGILAIIYGFCFLLSVISLFLIPYNRLNKGLPLLGFVLLYELFSYLLYGNQIRGGIASVIAYTCIPFLVMTQVSDPKSVLKAIVYLSIASIPFFHQVLAFDLYGNYLEMGATYSVIPSIIASIVLVIFYRDSLNILLLIGIITNAYYLAQVLAYGSRGAILCVVVAFILLALNRFDKAGTRMVGSRAIMILAIVVVLVITLLNAGPVIVAINRIASTRGINLAFLEKSVMLLQGNDLDNGRTLIYSTAVEGFLQHPVFGNGINMFEHNTGITYPHNFILQLLYDGGIVLAFVVLGHLLIGFRRMMTEANRDKYALLVVLFSISVPRLFFSQDIWEVVYYWALSAYFFCEPISYKADDRQRGATK